MLGAARAVSGVSSGRWHWPRYAELFNQLLGGPLTPAQYIIMLIAPLGLGVVYGLRPAKLFKAIRLLIGALTLYSAVWVLLAGRGPIFASVGHVLGAIIACLYLLIVNFVSATHGFVIGLVAHWLRTRAGAT